MLENYEVSNSKKLKILIDDYFKQIIGWKIKAGTYRRENFFLKKELKEMKKKLDFHENY